MLNISLGFYYADIVILTHCVSAFSTRRTAPHGKLILVYLIY
ncbi:hypothetical protein VCRA2113O324_410002 [Vibrio crassostreae]|nr:hypothetical protein VCRA2113O324_410002 [Vibrio crassostreae]CAK2123690.1 hypothetical protein VCRA2111O320_400028 [Vibrio crassostreae]CAK2257397.1 hypothetical protein VCRA2119O381_920002 [Vibrio crassostreae]CAK2979366.1 hypothetical protein VCRA2121O336_400028 [Vibrio crassostreae]CAK3443029.1 hypothetical protein VCRA2120O329_380029 [Vibrio crassostreae]